MPVGVVLIVLAATRLPELVRDGPRPPLDVAGAIAITGSITALAWALIRSAEVGWAALDVLVGILAAATLFVAFAVIETRVASAPLVPFDVFRTRLLAAGNALSFVSFLPVVSIWYFLTLHMQTVRGHGPIETGVLFLPIAISIVVGSQISFRVLPVVDARSLLVAGGLIAAGGVTWLSAATGSPEVVWVVVAASVAMLGSGLLFGPITVAATMSVPPELSGLASGLLNTTRQVGGALGLAVLGAVAAAVAGGTADGRDVVTTGYGTALIVGAAIFVVTGIIGAVALPPQVGRQDHASVAG